MIHQTGNNDSAAPGLPWMTLGIVAACFGVVAFLTPTLNSTIDPTLIFKRFGLASQNPSAEGFFGHIFIHSGWKHLAGTLFLLLLVGPSMEARFGRPLFAAFFVSSGLFSAAFFMTTAPDSPLPLLGASGAIAGMLGACIISHWKSNLRVLDFIAPRKFKDALQAPAWALLPLWFVSELISNRVVAGVGSTGGLAFAAHVGGFLWGAAIAAAIMRSRGELLFKGSGAAGKANRILAEASQARSNGNLSLAYQLLTRAAKESPDDPHTITEFWQAACAMRCASKAVPAMYHIASVALRDGDQEMAAQFWGDVAEGVPEALAEPTWLTRLVPVLLTLKQPKQAALALRHAVSEEQSTVSLGTALRVLDLAKGLDAQAGASAARRALHSPEFHDSKRERVKQQLAIFEEQTTNRPQTSGVDRSIAFEADPRYGATPSKPVDEEPAQQSTGLELDATGSLVTSLSGGSDDDSSPFIGLPPEDLMDLPLARFMSVKVIDAKPVELLEDSIVLMRPDESTSGLAYEKISAVAVAAIPGKASKPVLIIDLALNWNHADDEILRTVRLRSDEFDVKRLVPSESNPMDAFRTLVATLLSRSAGIPLPDENSTQGNPFQSYPDLETYQRKALSIN